MTLAIGGVAFDDVYSEGFPATAGDKERWTALGGNTTTNVPMLECDGHVYTQSSAVLRAAGRKAGLVPSGCDHHLYHMDKIIADADDLRAASYKVIFGGDNAAKVALRDGVLPNHLGNLQRQLGDSEWFAGDKLSVADVTAFDVCMSSVGLVPTALDKLDKLRAFCDRVAANPKLTAYRESEEFKGLMNFGPLTFE